MGEGADRGADPDGSDFTGAWQRGGEDLTGARLISEWLWVAARRLG